MLKFPGLFRFPANLAAMGFAVYSLAAPPRRTEYSVLQLRDGSFGIPKGRFLPSYSIALNTSKKFRQNAENNLR